MNRLRNSLATLIAVVALAGCEQPQTSTVPVHRFANAMLALHEVARAFGTFFEDYDVLLSPTLAKTPLKLGVQPMDSPDLDGYWALQGEVIPFTAPFNAAGAPAISLPLGWTSDGLPVGVQFGAAMGNEALLLRLASQIEAAAPWADRKPTIFA